MPCLVMCHFCMNNNYDDHHLKGPCQSHVLPAEADGEGHPVRQGLALRVGQRCYLLAAPQLLWGCWEVAVLSAVQEYRGRDRCKQTRFSPNTNTNKDSKLIATTGIF